MTTKKLSDNSITLLKKLNIKRDGIHSITTKDSSGEYSSVEYIKLNGITTSGNYLSISVYPENNLVRFTIYNHLDKQTFHCTSSKFKEELQQLTISDYEDIDNI